jgi:4-methyl-5(b-hydroxyethyl)-thiazole monophosphate biosynthesis
LKVLLFLANGVELIEASAFIDIFGWNRCYDNQNTEIVTCGLKKEIKSTFAIPLKVDILIDEVNIEDFDALAIPGGFDDYGFYEDAYDERFLQIIRNFNEAGKLIASICVGALPIGKSGILRGRQGTTYHLMNKRRQKQLEEFGVIIINEPIVVDKNVITSWCPATATGVAFKLLELLTSSDKVNELKELMGF